MKQLLFTHASSEMEHYELSSYNYDQIKHTLTPQERFALRVRKDNDIDILRYMEKENSKAFPDLTTERLTLRQLSDNDAQEIFLLRSDVSINKYLDRQPSQTLEDALEFIKKIKANSLSYWAIAQKGNERLVGTICLFDISDKCKNCEIGYELLTEHQGKGIMREAARKIIEYSIYTLGLKTIDAYTHKNNQSSTNLLKELNFISTDSIDEQNSNIILYRLNISSILNKEQKRSSR